MLYCHAINRDRYELRTGGACVQPGTRAHTYIQIALVTIHVQVRHYGSKKKPVPVLNDINMRLPKGYVPALRNQSL